jgi:carboxypeptidase C (cathepsin A)
LSNRDNHDIRELDPDPFPYKYYVQYLNTATVQKAIGAFQNFTRVSGTVENAFSGEDTNVPALKDVQELLEDGTPVTMYHGDADWTCNWLGGENASAQFLFNAGYVNLSTEDGVVHGQVKQYGAFGFVRIYEAGHEVPFYQPVAALTVFDRSIVRMDIATGTEQVVGNF